MRNISSAYKAQIKETREFCTKIIINYADGSIQTLTDLQDFKQLKFVDECSGSSEFEIGSAVIGEALITLNNRTGKFDGKNFYGAHISAYAGILVDGKPELLEMGHYIVDEPVSPGISIALTAYDNMILLDKAYVPGITYPATLAQIAQDACSQCGVILENFDFPRNSYIVLAAPTDVTCREVLAAAAQLAGCFVKAQLNGQIAITWYADTVSNTVSTLYSKNICTDDVTITGITVTSGEKTAQSGADGYRLSISDNIFLEETKLQETADYLGNKLIGLTFRPLSVSCQSDPSIEAGDRIAVKDEKGKAYQTIVTSTTFAVLESQKIACNAASPTINGGQRLSETSKAIIASRKYTDEAVEHERTERETALEEMNKQLSESSGMYITAQEQSDGSTIYYTHDKPLLEDSMLVCKFTATAMGISKDGGKTYPYGLDVSGTAILERIYVIGINAKYINTGTIVAKDKEGKIVFSVNIDTGAVYIDASCITMKSGDTIENYVEGAKQDIAQANGEITQIKNEITTVQNGVSSVTKAVSECVRKNELGEYGYVTSSELKQTSDSITATFTRTETELTNNTNEVSERVKKLESYVRLTDEGVEIGKSDSSVVQKSSNEKLAFVADGVELASFGKEQMRVKNAVVEQKLTMGKFAWIPRGDGSVSLKWIG